MPELVGAAEFARRLGITHTAVRNAINRGQIKNIRGRSPVRINWDSEFPRFMQTCQSQDMLRRIKYHLEHPPKSESESKKNVYCRKNRKRTYHHATRPPKGTRPSGEIEELLSKKIEEMTTADAAELAIVIKAKKAQLDYEKDEKKWIEVDLVLGEWLDMAAKMKSAMLSIPDRVTSMLEGLDYDAAHKLLTDEIKHALTNLSENLKCIEEMKED